MLPLPLQFLAAWLGVWLARSAAAAGGLLRSRIKSSRKGSATGKYSSRTPTAAVWLFLAGNWAASCWPRWLRSLHPIQSCDGIENRLRTSMMGASAADPGGPGKPRRSSSWCSDRSGWPGLPLSAALALECNRGGRRAERKRGRRRGEARSRPGAAERHASRLGQALGNTPATQVHPGQGRTRVLRLVVCPRVGTERRFMFFIDDGRPEVLRPGGNVVRDGLEARLPDGPRRRRHARRVRRLDPVHRGGEDAARVSSRWRAPRRSTSRTAAGSVSRRTTSRTPATTRPTTASSPAGRTAATTSAGTRPRAGR